MPALWGIVVAAGLMFAPSSDASGTDQDSTQLQPGSRVRYWSPEYQENPRIAVVHEFLKGEIIVQLEGRAGETQVRLEDIDRLEISVKPARNNVLKGAMWGSLGLSPERMVALQKIDGRSFRHAWEFHRALAAESPAWQSRPETATNRIWNKELESQLSLLLRICREDQRPKR